MWELLPWSCWRTIGNSQLLRKHLLWTVHHNFTSLVRFSQPVAHDDMEYATVVDILGCKISPCSGIPSYLKPIFTRSSFDAIPGNNKAIVSHGWPHLIVVSVKLRYCVYHESYFHSSENHIGNPNMVSIKRPNQTVLDETRREHTRQSVQIKPVLARMLSYWHYASSYYWKCHLLHDHVFNTIPYVIPWDMLLTIIPSSNSHHTPCLRILHQQVLSQDLAAGRYATFDKFIKVEVSRACTEHSGILGKLF